MGNQSTEKMALGEGVPTSKERADILIIASARNRNEEPWPKEMPPKISCPFHELWAVFDEVIFFSTTCSENVSGALSCSKTRGIYERVKSCVGGADNGNLVVNTECGQKEKKHMWNIAERKCHRKKFWGSILQGSSEPHQKGCVFVHVKKKNPTNK